MTTVVAQTVAAIVASLETTPAVSTNVDRVRLRPWGSSVSTAVAVRPLDADREGPALAFGGPDVWTVRVAVECYARAAAGTAPDAALDPLLQAVYTRLMADPTLGGALHGLEPERVQFDFDADAEASACGVITFVARITSGPDFT
jgi:hypothetical protein